MATFVLMLGDTPEFQIAAQSLAKKYYKKKVRGNNVGCSWDDLRSIKPEDCLTIIGHGDNNLTSQDVERIILNGAEFTSAAVSSSKTMQDFEPIVLAQKLYDAGLRECATIYLAGCNIGKGGEKSFVFKFAQSFRSMQGVRVTNISAPLGYIKFGNGKLDDGGADWIGRKIITAQGSFQFLDNKVVYHSTDDESRIKKKKNSNKVTYK